MYNFLPLAVRRVIEEFAKLPGIGPKSAQRLAIHLLHTPSSRVLPLGEAILKLKDGLIFCEKCWNISETKHCNICTNPQRDSSTICVVEEILDVMAIEKTREFNGLYHVLHGALSPVDSVGPEELKLAELFQRLKQPDEEAPLVKEIILATNPSLEGEATALYIQKNLLDSGIKVTRIARGLPVGGDLDYADEVTLSRALKGRSDF